MIQTPALVRLWQHEFGTYSMAYFRRDLLAGLTVAAVALPLALAFGVASQATAAAGLVTAIIAGIVIGALSGAPYQISGPTGAMSAVLVVIVQKYGLPGLWLAGLMAGAMLLALGLCKLGGIINFIPTPVITGFTSGIAIIIAAGQIDNFLGIQTPGAETTALKLAGYVTHPLPAINAQAVICALLVMATMLILPRVPRATHIPAALVGIALATALAWGLGWAVNTIGTIPSTIILDARLTAASIKPEILGDLLMPAMAIAALGAIESLLAGTVAGRMTGIKLQANQELIAQGVGNLLLPFVGGVPATAAIARISVGVKAGGVTRLVSIIHAVALLGSALFLGAIIGHIPLAALAGVLGITAWRMNEWHLIRFYTSHRLKSPTTVMIVTMIATVALDLTQAIIVGVLLSLLLFISQVSRLHIVPTAVDWERLGIAAPTLAPHPHDIKVVYVSGALFFGASNQLVEQVEELGFCRALILSMRGVPILDVSGMHALEQIWQNQIKRGGLLYLTGLQPSVRNLLERAGLVEEMGADKFCWGADQAITHASIHLTEALACEWRGGRKLESEVGPEDMPLGVVKMK